MKGYQQLSDDYANAMERLYPTAPVEPVVPLALPIEQYTTTYTNTAYGAVVFQGGRDIDGHAHLHCDLRDRTWPTIWDLRHVNAEHWIVSWPLYGTPARRACKAESRIGAEGKVEAFGIAVEPAMPDTLVWFEQSEGIY